MEITSIPFFNQDDFSSFFSPFQQSDTATTTTTNNNLNTNTKKRGRTDLIEDENGVIAPSNCDSIKEIISNFWSFDELEQTFETKKQKSQSMEEYFAGFPNDLTEIEIDQFEVKQAVGEASGSENHDAGVIGGGGGGGGQHRRLWVKDRSKAWWEQCNSPNFPDEEFRRAFRMSKSTFDMICDELDAAVMKKDTMLRLAIPVRQRVAVCIWRLATGEPLRLVSKRFGLGISTCHKLVLEVCAAIKTVLMPKFLNWPNETKMQEIKNEFGSISGIPNVGGSIYTTHIPIIAPKTNVTAYFNKRHTERNQRTSYSITVQGVVDSRRVFTDICIGWPGSLSDDKVMEKSALFERANRGLLKDVWIAGNSGFPLMDWLLVPYFQSNLTWTQHAFNEKIDETQKVAKEAFRRLKARWACLQKRTEVKLQDLPVVLGACCVLHNICEIRGEEMGEEMNFQLFDDQMVAENGVRSVGAMQARDNIAHNLLHQNPGGIGFR